jgi:hypothetical protein
MIMLDGATREELIRAFREIFNRLDPSSQAKELMRLDRKLNNRPVLIAEPIFETDRRYKFESVEHFVGWLKKNGYPNACHSNIYKVIRGERSSAYGYKIKLKEEK